MATRHLMFDTFPPDVLEATKSLIKCRPWGKPPIAQLTLLRQWCHEVEPVWGVPEPQIVIHAGLGNGRIDGRYYPEVHGIVIRKFSIVTFLHEYRHAVQYCGTKHMQDVGRDASEPDAYGWSCSLMHTVAPRRFARMVRAGRVIGVRERDLLTEGAAA